MSYLKGDGIPQLYCYGNNTTHNIMVMELLGENIETHFERCSKKFSLKTVLLLAVQMIERVKHIHNKNLVHRDLKPENFMTGYRDQDKKKIFLIDFGLCSKYRSSKTKEHIQMKKGKTMTGTARYASLNTLRGYEQSRRDDLESLGYIWVYFLKAKLPWQGVKAKTSEQKMQLILDQKSFISFDKLCSNLPKQFESYFEYCRALEFTDEPDYDFLIKLFTNLMIQHNIDPLQLDFDWINNTQTSPMNLNNTSQILNKSYINKSGNVIIYDNEKINVSLNISNIHNNQNQDSILKKPSMKSGVKRKGTSNSSKKVSFGKVEILNQVGEGKQEVKIIELVEADEKNINKSKVHDKQKSCHCIII